MPLSDEDHSLKPLSDEDLTSKLDNHYHNESESDYSTILLELAVVKTTKLSRDATN